MEIEAGEDECPECRNVVHFSPSLLIKFDAAEHQHKETLKAKKEKRLAKDLAKKEECGYRIRSALGSALVSYGPACLVVIMLAALVVVRVNSDVPIGEYHRNSETTRTDIEELVLANSYVEERYPDATIISQTKVDGGYIAEVKGQNAFGGTVRNQIFTSDDGATINLSVP